MLLTAATAAACTSDPTTPPPSSTVASPSSAGRPSRSPADTAGRKAVDVYIEMWQNMASAARTSDWQSPLLSEFTTGEALNTISRGLYTDHQNGLVTKGAPKNSPSVSTVEPPDNPTKVMITDCGDSTNWLKYRADTGELADDEPGGRRAITAVVNLQGNGSWMVSDFAVQELGTC